MPTLYRLHAEQLKKLGTACYTFVLSLSFFPKGSAKRRISNLLENDMTRWIQPLLSFRDVSMTLFVLGLAASIGGFTPIVALAAPAAPVGEDKGAIEITGTVLMADGTPANGALVWAAKGEIRPLIRRETKAGANGQFKLSLPEGHWFIWASKGSQGGEARNPQLSTQWEVTAAKKPAPFVIRMDERGWLTGRLLEAETGKPIADGRIFHDNGIISTTGPDGVWKVGGMSRTHHEAYAVAKGRQRQRILLDTTAKADTELEVPLPLGAKIAGTVTDQDGKPIPNAWVGRSTSGSYFSIHGLWEHCDQNGRFEYDDAVPADEPTRLSAGAPGYRSDDQNNIQRVPGKAAQLQFRLHREPAANSIESTPGEKKKRVLTGRVLDPDRRPAEGVLIRWGVMPSTESITARTDGSGSFKMIVPDEEQFVSVLPRQFEPQFVPVEQGANKPLELVLDKGNTVSGVVLDDRKQPIEGVMVVPVIRFPIPKVCNQYWLSESTAVTDRSGKFLLKGIPDETKFDFLKSGLSDLRDQELVLNNPNNTVQLFFGGAVQGKVVDAAGQPIRNFRITVNQPREAKSGENSGGYFAGYCGFGVRYTSADGSFVLTGLPAGGVFRLQAYSDGHGQAVLDRVESVPINHLDKATPALLHAAAPASLRIQVTDANGRTVPHARVTLVDGHIGLDKQFSWGYHNASWENMIRGRCDAKGIAAFSHLSFSEATLLVEAEGFARKRVPWRKGEKTIDVKMAPQAVLAGQLESDASSEGIGFYATLLSPELEQIHVKIDGSQRGAFQIKELPAGKWTLMISSTGEIPKSIQETVELKEGEVTRWKGKWKP